MTKSKQIISVSIILFLIGLFVSLGIPVLRGFLSGGGEKSWDFERWEVEININPDSTFLVKEKQTFNFRGNFHWVKRDIAKNRLRKISEVKVFDESGRQLEGKEIEIEENEEQASIKLNFDLTDTQKTWTFQYRVHGGLGFFDDYDELYWNAVSSEREVLIKEVEVFVYFPEEIEKGKIDQTLYVGAYESKNTSLNYEVLDEKTLRYWGENIGPYNNLTIVAGWPKGLIEKRGVIVVDSEPISEVLVDNQKTGLKTPAVLEQGYDISLGQHSISAQRFGWNIKEPEMVSVEKGETKEIGLVLEKTSWMEVLSYLPFLIPLIFVFFIVKRRQRYSKIEKTIIAHYEPPGNLAPLAVGGLIDGQIQPRDITSVLIDLAYRGYIKVIEEKERGLFGEKKKYYLVKTGNLSDPKDIKDYEWSLINTIFGSKDMVKVEDLKGRTSLSKDLNKIKERILKDLVEKGYFKIEPGKEKIFYILSLVLFPLAAFFVFSFSSFKDCVFRDIYLAPSLMICSVLAFLGLIFSPLPLSPKGAEAKWKALGFKEYLQVAERFRLGACEPETFERFLPYAIVFKVVEKWSRRFSDIYKEPPSWFVSSDPSSRFTVIRFANNISALSSSVSAAVVTGTASSGSGFGGGGFAGGGGGGGGSSAG